MGSRTAFVLVAVLLLVETGSVLSKALRYYVILRALQYEPSVLQVTALTIVSVTAVAIGFFPGGLGLSEILAGAISPLVDLPVAVGVLTSGIDHLLHIAVLAAATGIILLGARGSSVALVTASRASLPGSAQDEDERRHDR